MKFRRNAPALLIGSIVLVIAAVTGIAKMLTDSLLASANDGDYTLMRQVFADTIGDAQDEVLSRAEAVAAIPEVRGALIAHDRPKLLAATQKMWEVQEQKYDLDEAQFHLPPGISFLRLHKPELHDDDQSTYRPMLADVHQYKVTKKGLAVSTSGPFVFGTVPIMDDAGKLAGSFEMGLDFSPELDKVKQSYGLESVIFFEEKLLREVGKDISPEVMSPKNQVGRFIRYHTTNPALAAALVTDKDLEIKDPKSYEREFGKTSWGVQLIPVYDYANKRIGVVALATDFGDDRRLARRALVWQCLAAFFGIVILAGVTLVVIRGLVLKPVEALGERMRALADGDASKPADELGSYADELQPLAESYEKLRRERGARS